MKRSLLITFGILLFVVVQVSTVTNLPPVADAGPDTTMGLGASIVLQGAATDPEWDPITEWSWSIVSQPAGSSPAFGPVTSQTPTFTPDMMGVYEFTLSAKDYYGFGAPDSVVVSVTYDVPVKSTTWGRIKARINPVN